MKTKKHIFIIIYIILVFAIMCGCSSSASIDVVNEDTDYDDGYDDGYSAGYEEGCKENGYGEKELHRFQIAIAELVYDEKYDVVKEILEYNQDGVEAALELEFGTSDLSAIEKFIQEYNETVAGICGICSKTVYLNEVGYTPKGMDCAHRKCVAEYEEDKD